MTEPTSEGNVYITCFAFQSRENEIVNEKGKNSNGQFRIVAGEETTISLKPGATKDLKESAEYKRYNKNKEKMIKKFSKGKVGKLKEDNANKEERE